MVVVTGVAVVVVVVAVVVVGAVVVDMAVAVVVAVAVVTAVVVEVRVVVVVVVTLGVASNGAYAVGVPVAQLVVAHIMRYWRPVAITVSVTPLGMLPLGSATKVPSGPPLKQ